MILPKDFYKKVEEPGFLKHILYGDSVHGDSNISIRNNTRTIECWWHLFATCREPNIKINKEYLYGINAPTVSIRNHEVYTSNCSYIMRHWYKGKMWEIKTSTGRSVKVTDQHSLINIVDDKPAAILPKDTNICIEKTDHGEEIYYTSKIIEKKQFDFEGYVYDICVPETQNFFANGICVHNTDSIFIKIPYKGAENKSPKERWKITEFGASLINNSIAKYYNDWLLPRSNISIEHNKTDFKPELVILAIIFLHVKKNYAYLYDVKEGEIYEKPKVKKTSNLGIKSDMTELTRKLLDDLIVKISLNMDIMNKHEACMEIVKEYRMRYIELIKKFDYGDIGIPGKWGKKALMYNGMKIYNYMNEKEVFSFGSAGKFIYCLFKNKDIFNDSGVLHKDMNGICFPYTYDVDLLRRKMEKFGLSIDVEMHWNKIFSTTCERVLDVLKI
jgi:hypothetical protein